MRSSASICLAVAILGGFSSSTPLRPRSSNGPVISTNFQDPSVINFDGTFYAFSGPNGNPAVNAQVATSSDFSSWTVRSDYEALPNAGSWTASPPHVWAPDINQLADGSFILYYTAAVASSPSQHCVGAALSTSIEGTFSPLDTPLACDLAIGGSIDPDGFTDPITGNTYIVYKVDGNSISTAGGLCNNGDGSTPTPILLQQMNSDGYTLVGGPIEILTNLPSDGGGIEAPSIFYDPGSGLYVLSYNSGCFTNTGYHIAYATSPAVTGPYARKGTLLATGSTAGDVQLPGALDVVKGEDTKGGIRAVFHGDLNLAWFQGTGARDRGMYAVQLSTSGGAVSTTYLY